MIIAVTGNIETIARYVAKRKLVVSRLAKKQKQRADMQKEIQLLTSNLENFSALYAAFSAFTSFVSTNSLNSTPLRKTAGVGRVGPNQGTSSRAVTLTLYLFTRKQISAFIRRFLRESAIIIQTKSDCFSSYVERYVSYGYISANGSQVSTVRGGAVRVVR